jgi:hypothetical protein
MNAKCSEYNAIAASSAPKMASPMLVVANTVILAPFTMMKMPSTMLDARSKLRIFPEFVQFLSWDGQTTDSGGLLPLRTHGSMNRSLGLGTNTFRHQTPSLPFPYTQSLSGEIVLAKEDSKDYKVKP